MKKKKLKKSGSRKKVGGFFFPFKRIPQLLFFLFPEPIWNGNNHLSITGNDFLFFIASHSTLWSHHFFTRYYFYKLCVITFFNNPISWTNLIGPIYNPFYFLCLFTAFGFVVQKKIFRRKNIQCKINIFTQVKEN